MPSDEQFSVYDFLKGKFTFTNEPLWFRLAIYLIGILGIIAILWILHRWALPGILVWHLGPKMSSLINALKGSSP